MKSNQLGGDIMKLHLDNNIAEGTPEELVEYLRLLEAESTENDKEEEEEVYNDVYDKGAFYTVTDEAEDSALPVGAILQHQHGRMFRDSQGNLCIVSKPSFLDRGSTYKLDDAIKQHSFELAKQLGIQLKSTTDFAVEAEGKYFKVTEPYTHLRVGDIVTIAKDTKDGQPQCKDRHGNFNYVLLRDLELLEDYEEEEEFGAENYSIFSPEAQTPSTDIQVGDRVKVLKSEGGAEGEATVTKVLNHGDVELDGISKDGTYLTNWSNHVSNLEKIEVDDKQAEEAEGDKLMGYNFWYIDGGVLNHLNVLKASLEGYFEDSKGRRYTYQAVSGLVKPIGREDAREEFEKARHMGKLLKYYSSGDIFIREH